MVTKALFGAYELLALVAVGPAEAFVADDEHRRLRGHVVSGVTAMLDDERTRIAAAERAEFSGEDDDVPCDRLVRRHCVQSASAAVRKVERTQICGRTALKSIE